MCKSTQVVETLVTNHIGDKIPSRYVAPGFNMASDWGQNWNLDFVASKGPTHVETSSSGHRFRFFVASLSW